MLKADYLGYQFSYHSRQDSLLRYTLLEYQISNTRNELSGKESRLRPKDILLTNLALTSKRSYVYLGAKAGTTMVVSGPSRHNGRESHVWMAFMCVYTYSIIALRNSRPCRPVAGYLKTCRRSFLRSLFFPVPNKIWVVGYTGKASWKEVSGSARGPSESLRVRGGGWRALTGC